MSKNIDGLEALLDRPIAFHRIYATLTGSVTAGLMLSQGVFWSTRGSDPDGWFWKTQADWYEETMLTRYEQESARKKLLSLVSPSGVHVWKEQRRGVPAKLFYRLDREALMDCVRSASLYAENPHTGLMENHNQDEGKTTVKKPEKPHSLYTKTTSETTTENTSKTTTNQPAVSITRAATKPVSNGSVGSQAEKQQSVLDEDYPEEEATAVGWLEEEKPNPDEDYYEEINQPTAVYGPPKLDGSEFFPPVKENASPPPSSANPPPQTVSGFLLALLTDNEVGMSAQKANRLVEQAKDKPVELIQHIATWWKEKAAGKRVNGEAMGPGCLCKRIAEKWKPEPLTDAFRRSDVYYNHFPLTDDQLYEWQIWRHLVEKTPEDLLAENDLYPPAWLEGLPPDVRALIEALPVPLEGA